MNTAHPAITAIHNAHDNGLLTTDELWLNRFDYIEAEIRPTIQKLSKIVTPGVALKVGEFYLMNVVKPKLDKNAPVKDVCIGLQSAFLDRLNELKRIAWGSDGPVNAKLRAIDEHKKLSKKFKQIYKKEVK